MWRALRLKNLQGLPASSTGPWIPLAHRSIRRRSSLCMSPTEPSRLMYSAARAAYAWAGCKHRYGRWVRIQAVPFDLDNTLFDHEGSAKSGLGGFLRYLQAEPSADLARSWFEIEQLNYDRFLAKDLSFLEQRRERLRQFLPLAGIVPPRTDAQLDELFAASSLFWTASSAPNSWAAPSRSRRLSSYPAGAWACCRPRPFMSGTTTPPTSQVPGMPACGQSTSTGTPIGSRERSRPSQTSATCADGTPTEISSVKNKNGRCNSQ